MTRDSLLTWGSVVVLLLARVHRVSPIRSRRSSCQDGSYMVDDRTCCQCAAGQHLSRHCEVKEEDRVCEYCEQGFSYSSSPNHRISCEPCTSCSQPSAHLEVKEACTIAMDTVCQCKDGHYCHSGSCLFCDPCDKCEDITVTPCTGTNNTVCNDSNEQNPAAVVVPVVFILVALAACGIMWKKKLLCFRKSTGSTMSPEPRDSVIYRPIKGTDLSPHIPDLARVLGWHDMRDIALATGVSSISIENHQQNHPQNVNEQTVQLLLEWVEKQGHGASEELEKQLRAMGKKAKLEKVVEIMKKDRLQSPG